jgi:hypothetical protein
MPETANSSLAGQAHLLVSGPRRAHIAGVPTEPAMEVSEELAALFRRADLATANARRLVDENDRWRRAILRQFDYMFELGVDIRKSRHP